MTHHPTLETAKHIADIAAAGTALGTIAQVLPPVASLFTIAWLGIRIYESDTVQKWLKRKRDD